MQAHLRHHARFYASLLFGTAVGVWMGLRGSRLAVVLAGNTFFASYLLLMTGEVLRGTPECLRCRAIYDDEGMPLILVIMLTAITVSLVAIFLLLAKAGPRDVPHLVVSLASVPLGWLTLHTLLAFRYAHLYYTPAEDGGGGGLQFPGTEQPDSWDFLYYSFVVGMTCQVSDVQVATTPMRRLTLAHGVLSFFFNAVIVALTVGVMASV